MENKRLMDQFEACQKSYKEFVSAAEENFLAEERTKKRMRDCKLKALEMKQALDGVVRTLEGIAGYIDFPLV